MPDLPIADPVLKFTLLFGVILAVPLLSKRLRVPEIAILIAAGVLLGPNGSGALERDSTMVGLGTSGLLYILFLAGVEVDLHDFRRVWGRSVVFGLLALLIPLGAGFAIFLGLFGFPWPKSLLLASLIAAQTPVVYPALARLGLARRESVVVSVGATMVADTGALLALAVVANWVGAEGDPDSWRRLAVSSGLFALGMGFVLPRVARAVFRKSGAEGGQSFLFVLVAVFGCAFLAHVAGLEPILGAFFAGLALNRTIPEHSVLMNRIQFFGHFFFIPFFTIWVGMLLDFRALAGDVPGWTLTGALVGLALAGKGAAAWVTKRLFRYRAEDGWLLFAFGAAKAAATLAAAIVGFRLGLFDEGILNGTILLIVVTCLASSWIADRYGRRLAVAEPVSAPPAAGHALRFMVPVSNPATAGPLIDLAALIQKASGSREPLYVLHVVREEEELRAGLSRGQDVLRECASRGAASGLAIVPLARVDLSIAEGLVRAAKEVGADPLLLGWNAHPGAADLVFGSLLDKVLERHPGRVLVCRTDHAFATSRRLVVAWPPFAESAAGFEEGWADVKVLARQLTLKPTAFVPCDDTDTVRRRLDRVKPAVPADFVAAGSWKGVLTRLEGELKPQDVFVFLGAREGSVAWNPGLASFLRSVADRHPETRLIAVYPPASAAERAEAEGGPVEPVELAIPDPGGIRIGLEGIGVEGAVERMLSGLLPRAPETVRGLKEALLSTVREYRAEVAPGVLLLHASDSPFSTCTLLAGLSAKGLDDPLCPHPVRALFVVLQPRETPPDAHLRALAALARALHRPGALERLVSAPTEAEVRAVLVPPGEAGA